MAAAQEVKLTKKSPAKGACGKETKRKWEKPTWQDVSGGVMAQPYIRFT
ncbi:MAG: hypothetical protein HYV35_03875 [Lentisphaerae bacterium]|nr:hypothetical protein [Lentisphaerota bacterium]